MDSSPYIAVGRIVKTHGVAGEISVAQSTTLPLEEVVGRDVWIVPPVRLARPYRVHSIRQGPKGPLLTLDGVADVEFAREMTGASICLPRHEVPDSVLAEAFDPLGFSVVDVERGELGTVEDTIVTGANDVWVVRGRLGEVLIPVIDDVVQDVDDHAETITVSLLPGLIEDES
jgi:16S rRNA processing protein RimM